MTTTRKRSAPSPVDEQALPDVRLAAPSTALAELGIDLGTWKVLTESIFPSAKTPEGVLLAVHYCQARKLDIACAARCTWSPCGPRPSAAR